MNEDAITNYILKTCEGTSVATASGNSFFIYDQDNNVPFATIVTNNEYDDVSGLDRASVFRLNIGITKQTYGTLFQTETPEGEEIAPGTGCDFTELDRLMPHPVYGRMYWVCILNPQRPTFEATKPLLAEAYEIAVRKFERVKAARKV